MAETRQQFQDARYVEQSRAANQAVNTAESYLRAFYGNAPIDHQRVAKELAGFVHVFRDLLGECDSWRGGMERVRRVLTEAGVPCFYGMNGTYTVHEPEGPHVTFRPLHECVADLVKAAKVRVDCVERLLALVPHPVYGFDDLDNPDKLTALVEKVETLAAAETHDKKTDAPAAAHTLIPIGTEVGVRYNDGSICNSRVTVIDHTRDGYLFTIDYIGGVWYAPKANVIVLEPKR